MSNETAFTAETYARMAAAARAKGYTVLARLYERDAARAAVFDRIACARREVDAAYAHAKAAEDAEAERLVCVATPAAVAAGVAGLPRCA